MTNAYSFSSKFYTSISWNTQWWASEIPDYLHHWGGYGGWGRPWCPPKQIARSAIEGRYFEDTDGNGKDNGNGREPAIAGQVVKLFQADGTLVAKTRTDEDGYYRFDKLAAGDYFVRFKAVEGADFITANVGRNDRKDSDVTKLGGAGNGNTDVFRLGPWQTKRNVDAGVEFADPVAEARDDAGTVGENGTVILDLLANDIGTGRVITGINGAELEEIVPGVFGVELASSAVLTLNDDGTMTYATFPLATANPEAPFDYLQAGAAFIESFTYTITDASGAVSTATATITVTGENDAPQAIGNIINEPVFTEGSGIQDSILTVEDYDDHPDTLTMTLIDAPTLNGVPLTITLGTGATFSIDTSEYASLAPGEQALFTFTYTATDPHGATSGVISQSYVIEGVGNLAAADDASQTTENGRLALDILGNDATAGQPVQITEINGAALVPYDAPFDPLLLAPDGTIGYAGLASGATVYVLADMSLVYETAGGPFVIADAPLVGFDHLGEGEMVTESFTYTISDGEAASTATVSIDIQGENDAPLSFFGFSDYQVDEGSGSYTFDLVPIIDPDHPLDALTYTITSLPDVNGDMVDVAMNGDGTFTVNTDQGFDSLVAGEALNYSFLYTATDPLGASGAFFQSFTVNGSSVALLPGEDLAETTENGTVAIDVLANDSGEALTITGINTAAFEQIGDLNYASLPSGGTVFLEADGTLTYSTFPITIAGGQIPPFDPLQADEAALDSFTYSVTDAEGAVAEAIVWVTVIGENDAPFVPGNIFVQPEFTEGTGIQSAAVVAQDNDDPVTSLTATLVDAPTLNGQSLSIQFDATGPGYSIDTAEYAALGAGERAEFSFTYRLTDPHGAASVTATQTYAVLGVAGGAVAFDDTATTSENAPVGLDVLANDVGDGLTLTQINGVDIPEVFPGFFAAELDSGAVVILRDDGTLDYQPAPLATVSVEGLFDYLQQGDTVVERFTYTAETSDGTAITGAASVTLSGENDAPQAIGNVINLPQFTEGTGLQNGQMTFEDYDDPVEDVIVTLVAVPELDGAPLTVSVGSGLGFAIDTGEYTSLGAGEDRFFTFDYQVTDPQGATSSVIQQSFSVTGVDELIFG